jgi:hypothetical protein
MPSIECLMIYIFFDCHTTHITITIHRRRSEIFMMHALTVDLVDGHQSRLQSERDLNLMTTTHALLPEAISSVLIQEKPEPISQLVKQRRKEHCQ